MINLMRLGYGGWIIFDLLNWVGVLNFTLDFSWLGLVITSGFVWGVIEFTSAKLKKSTGQTLPWIVYFGGLFSVSMDALGDIAHWYSAYEWYDQMTHALGGGMAALIAFFVFWRLNQAGNIRVGEKLLGFMAFTTTAFLGVLYELEEYIEDVFTGGNRLGTGVDTANDMMWNTIGALVVVIIAAKIVNRKFIKNKNYNLTENGS